MMVYIVFRGASVLWFDVMPIWRHILIGLGLHESPHAFVSLWAWLWKLAPALMETEWVVCAVYHCLSSASPSISPNPFCQTSHNSLHPSALCVSWLWPYCSCLRLYDGQGQVAEIPQRDFRFSVQFYVI